LFRGRSMSSRVSSFQLDLAWRNKYRVFMAPAVYYAVIQLG
jgi:hypothetical protein